jgi:hypothetical protein
MAMDVLTDVMQTLRVRSNLYGRAEFTAPWGIHEAPSRWRAATSSFCRMAGRTTCAMRWRRRSRPLMN